jgi:hypothetical protein
MTPRRVALTAAAFALLLGRAASAQTQGPSVQSDSPQWLKDRRFAEGIGVHTGDLELHWSLAGEFGYDSNYFLRTNMNPTAVTNAGAVPAAGSCCANGPPATPVIPSLEFRLTPSLAISTVGQPTREGAGGEGQPPIAFRAGVSATYRDFINISSDANKSASVNDVSSNRNVSGAADARLDVLPGKPWAADFTVSYARTIQPNSIAANPDLSFNSDTVGGTAELVAQPGSGTLDWRIGGGYQATLFEQSQALGFNNGTAIAYTRGRWGFRPRTALLYDGSASFINYTNSSQALDQGLVSSTPVRTRIGLSGLITNRFALLVFGGWGASFYSTQNPKQPQFDAPIGQAELKWFLSASPGIAQASDLTLALSSISVGYARDFQNSYLGNFYTSDRGYVRLNYFFAGRVVVNVEGGVGAVEYPTMYWGQPSGGQAFPLRHDSFTDTRADATIFGEYRFTDTLGLNGTFRYTENFSGTHNMPVVETAAAAGTAPIFYDMAWSRLEAYLGFRWFM